MSKILKNNKKITKQLNNEIDILSNKINNLNLNKDNKSLGNSLTSSSTSSSTNNLTNKLNKWNPWDPNNKIPYKTSDRKAYGNGEEKFGNEFGIKPKGQNSPYDFDYNGNKLEVKQLDKNSFNSGKEGRIKISSISKILETIENIILFINTFSNENDPDHKNLIDIKEKCKKITDIGELSESKCKKFGDFDCILTGMNKIYNDLLLKTNKKIEGYKINGEQIQYTLYKYWKICQEQSISKEEIISKIGQDAYTNCEQIKLLSNPYIIEPGKLRNEIDESCQIYKDYMLVFVDINKGYYIMNKPENKIKFQRITKGHPRFVVDI